MSEILRPPTSPVRPAADHSCAAAMPDWWEPHVRYDGLSCWPQANGNQVVKRDKIGAVVRCSCGVVYEARPYGGFAIWQPCGWLRRRRLRREGCPVPLTCGD